MEPGYWNKQKALNLKAEIYWYKMKNPFYTQKQIAEYLGISPVTVSSHMKDIRAGWRPAQKSSASAG